MFRALSVTEAKKKGQTNVLLSRKNIHCLYFANYLGHILFLKWFLASHTIKQIYIAHLTSIAIYNTHSPTNIFCIDIISTNIKRSQMKASGLLHCHKHDRNLRKLATECRKAHAIAGVFSTLRSHFKCSQIPEFFSLNIRAILWMSWVCLHAL